MPCRAVVNTRVKSVSPTPHLHILFVQQFTYIFYLPKACIKKDRALYDMISFFQCHTFYIFF